MPREPCDTRPTPLRDALEARVRPRPAADLRRGLTVRDHDVGREVVRPADQRRADAVGVDGDVTGLEFGDLLRGEAARDHDPHLVEALAIERLADVRDEPGFDARRLEVAHLPPER